MLDEPTALAWKVKNGAKRKLYRWGRASAENAKAFNFWIAGEIGGRNEAAGIVGNVEA